jgi:hypothetical protein
VGREPWPKGFVRLESGGRSTASSSRRVAVAGSLRFVASKPRGARVRRSHPGTALTFEYKAFHLATLGDADQMPSRPSISTCFERGESRSKKFSMTYRHRKCRAIPRPDGKPDKLLLPSRNKRISARSPTRHLGLCSRAMPGEASASSPERNGGTPRPRRLRGMAFAHDVVFGGLRPGKPGRGLIDPRSPCLAAFCVRETGIG